MKLNANNAYEYEIGTCPIWQFSYSALPNKHTIMLINFCKIGNAVLLLLGAVW